ncbi:phage protein [Streptococcus pyogenes]|nr:phage protein [Streptococcus pyogenes]
MTIRKSKYWRDRIKKEMDAKEADDISLEQSMKQLYDYHFRNIEKEIESFYQRYADKEKIDITEARKRASELDISAYQKKAKELVAKAEKLRKEGRTVTRDDFTHQENADMSIYNLAMKTNALELLRLNIDLEMQELANGEHKLTRNFLMKAIAKKPSFKLGY